MPGRLEGRIALVTGASRGIGAAVARRFAAEGAQVVLVARTRGALEEVDDAIRATDGKATLCPLDLTDFDAIDQMAVSIAQRFGRLDVLVGNAGTLGTLTPVAHLDPKVWDRVLAVNVTANLRLIRACDPLLRVAPAGRAIFVSSGAATGTFAYWGAYSASKAALDKLVQVYAAEMAKTRVRVNILDPGAIRTGMRAEAFPGEDPATLRPPEAIADAFVELAEPGCTRHGETVRTY